MNSWLIIFIILAVLAILALVFFIEYDKLKKYKIKMNKAEASLEEEIIKKIDVISSINALIKKVINKKDYLIDYIDIKTANLSNIEKEIKLNEADKLISDICYDYKKLANNKDIKKNVNSLREINESIAAAKTIFNQNATLSNQALKHFPTNIIGKLSNCKIKNYYNNNKTDDTEAF